MLNIEQILKIILFLVSAAAILGIFFFKKRLNQLSLKIDELLECVHQMKHKGDDEMASAFVPAGAASDSNVPPIAMLEHRPVIAALTNNKVQE